MAPAFAGLRGTAKHPAVSPAQCNSELSHGWALQDKEALEGRMTEYGAGLVKLKEASFQDAAARRDGQRALQAAHAELKGSALREQVGLINTPSRTPGSGTSLGGRHRDQLLLAADDHANV